MGRKTIEPNGHCDSKLKKITEIENRKKVKEMRHTIDQELVFLGLRRDGA